jgi:hypothetical protein
MPASASAGTGSRARTLAGHPWHDAIAEARVIDAESRLEVAMRVDAAHLEAMIASRTGEAFDLGRASGGSPTELRLAAIVRAGMEARFAPASGAAQAAEAAGETSITPAEDRFDFHWLGRELEGSDCWLYFEWVAPPADEPRLRPVQVRATLLIEPAMRQVNTVSLLGHGAAGFDADRTDWADVELRLRPRTPGPLRVARAGDAGPRVVIVSEPGGAGDIERRLAGRLRDVARVEVAFWPGLDGGAPPPTGLPAGGWARWTGDALRRHVAAEPADPPAVVVLVGRAAELARFVPGAGDAAPEIVVAAGRSSRARADERSGAEPVDLFARSIAARFGRDLDAVRPGDASPAETGGDLDAVTARVRARIEARADD